MITTNTPYKLAEIIRDTWPGLYNHQKNKYNKEQIYDGPVDRKKQ